MCTEFCCLKHYSNCNFATISLLIQSTCQGVFIHGSVYSQPHCYRLVLDGVERASEKCILTVYLTRSITVEYDAKAKALAFGKNDGELKMAFQNVVKQASDLYPMVLFNSRRTSKVSGSCGFVLLLYM